VFTAASPVNLQNDRVYTPSNAKKCDIAPEHLLRCRPTFSSSLIAVSKLGCTELFFVEPGLKVNGRYYVINNLFPYCYLSQNTGELIRKQLSL